MNGAGTSFFDKGLVAANYFYWFLLANFYFLLSNIILIEIYLNFDLTIENLPVFIAAALPSGFSIMPILGLMGKLVREGHVNATRDYFRFYVMNLKESLSYWGVVLMVTGSLMIAGNRVQNPVLNAVLALSVLLTVLLALVLFVIASRFSFSFKTTFSLAVFYLVKGWDRVLGSMVVLGAFYLALTRFSPYVILVVSSGAFYLIALLFKDILLEIEAKMKKN